jgi:hypothetical protein
VPSPSPTLAPSAQLFPEPATVAPASGQPALPAVAQAWYDELAVSQPGDATRGWPLLILLGAFGHAFGPLHDLVRDTDAGPGWSQVMDPTRAPAWALPWLAQFAGVTIDAGLDDSAARRRITHPPRWERGTLRAMALAARPTLTGTAQVRVIERDGGPYRLTAITRTDETVNPAATRAALRSQKPAGLILNHVISDAPMIDEGARTIDAGTGSVDTATISDIT